jgi:hypothetical protein
MTSFASTVFVTQNHAFRVDIGWFCVASTLKKFNRNFNFYAGVASTLPLYALHHSYKLHVFYSFRCLRHEDRRRTGSIDARRTTTPPEEEAELRCRTYSRQRGRPFYSCRKIAYNSELIYRYLNSSKISAEQLKLHLNTRISPRPPLRSSTPRGSISAE